MLPCHCRLSRPSPRATFNILFTSRKVLFALSCLYLSSPFTLFIEGGCLPLVECQTSGLENWGDFPRPDLTINYGKGFLSELQTSNHQVTLLPSLCGFLGVLMFNQPSPLMNIIFPNITNTTWVSPISLRYSF